jgi:hypothetical protein
MEWPRTWNAPDTTAKAAEKEHGSSREETAGAYDSEIHRELVRTDEISTAGQGMYGVCSSWSGACLHQTRPTGRLARIRLVDSLIGEGPCSC